MVDLGSLTMSMVGWQEQMISMVGKLIFEVIETVKSETVDKRGLLYKMNMCAKIKVALQGEPY